MRGRVRSGRQRITGGWWRVSAAAALLVLPGVLGAQEPAATQRAQAPEGRTHTVKRGDTLWDLAQTYLGDPFQWPEIYRLNRDVVEDPHWIYPGEVLRIPGATQAAEAEPEAEAPAPAPVREDRNAPTVFSAGPRGGGQVVLDPDEEKAPTLRTGEIMAAPWVDTDGAPVAAGRILDSRELPGIAMRGTKNRFQVYEKLLVTLPADARGTVGERFLAVRQGPHLEEMGQVVVPTALLELVRPPRDGEAAIARVVRLFEDLGPEHRLVRFDPALLQVGSRMDPAAGAERLEGHVRWVVEDHVLPTLGNYVVLDLRTATGVRPGDYFEVYEPRQVIREDAPLRPETPVARVQVVRSTPFGTTAVILGHEQPAIKSGQRVRRVSVMR